MGLFETLALQVGPAVGKALLKCWLKDSKLAAEVSSSLVDLLKAKTTDVIAQQRGKRQFEDIGERVALSLKPIFDAEGNTLEEGSLNAVALAIAETFNKSQVISKALAEQELEPDKLAKYLMNSYAHATRHLSEAEIALYQRITSEISQQIVDIASQLPAFTEHSFAEILIRERKLLTIANQILEEVRRIHRGSEQENHERQEVARFEAEYCRAVIRRLDRLELFGVDVSTASQRYRLSVAYVSLSVEPQTLRVYREKKFEERMLTTPSAEDSKDEDGKIIIPVHELLAKTHHLLIQGLAGSGKTTLLQWIAVSAALRAFTGKLVRLNNSIPFFIPLRQCLESGYPTPEHFPRFIAPAIASTMPTNWVHERLNSGRAVVLIDGVDEVPETQRGDVRVWLEELVATYPNARFIVTARPHAIAGGWLEQGSFSYAQLRPMDLPCIHVFIDHWYAAVREQLQDDEEKAELNPLAEHLKRIIGRSLQLRNLAMNPLLCAMLCALHRDRRQQLPSDRIELYEAGCNMLLERRDRERRLELRDYPILSYRQKRVLLQDLAYWLMINKWPMVTQQSAQERLGRKLRHMPGITEDTSASEVLRLFLDRSGMLRKPVEGWVDFAHLTFQEYLAAQEALDAGDLGLLTNNAPDDQWREVIILAAGLASPKVCEQLIGALITKGDQEPQNRHKLHLLAMSGCEASLVLGGRMKVEVQNRLSQFVPPKTIAEVQALASVGDLAVPYLANDVGHKPTIAAACVQALARIGSETALETLESYSRDAREIIVDELLRAWDSFNPEDFARRVLLSGASLSLDGDILLERVRLERIRYLTKLTMLDLSNSLDVNDLSWMEDLQELTSLNLAHCVRVSDIRPFSKLSNLVSLNLSGCSNVTDLSPLAHLTNLSSLNLAYCTMEDLSPLASLAKLASLDLSSCPNISNLSPLAHLTNLSSLNLAYCTMEDLSPLASLAKLTSLNLAACKMDDLRLLASLTNLSSLSLAYCEIDYVGPLTSLTNLKSLDLSGCLNVSDLRPLASLINLGSLNLAHCIVRDLSPLSNLSSLSTLILISCKHINDLSPLALLPNLSSLDLMDCRVNGLSPLEGLTDLASLTVATLIEKLS